MTRTAAPKVAKRAVDAWIDGPAGESPPSGISEALVHLIDRVKAVAPPADYVAAELVHGHQAYGEYEERRRWVLVDWACRVIPATWLQAAGQWAAAEDMGGLGEARSASALPPLVDALVLARRFAEAHLDDLPEELWRVAEATVRAWAREEAFVTDGFSLAERKVCGRAAEIRTEAAADEALWLSGAAAALDAAAMCWLWPPESAAAQAVVAARATLRAVARRAAMQEAIRSGAREQGPPWEHSGWSDLSQEVSILLGDAARTGLRPTVDSLQESTEYLLARMLRVDRESWSGAGRAMKP